MDCSRTGAVPDSFVPWRLRNRQSSQSRTVAKKAERHSVATPWHCIVVPTAPCTPMSLTLTWVQLHMSVAISAQSLLLAIGPWSSCTSLLCDRGRNARRDLRPRSWRQRRPRSQPLTEDSTRCCTSVAAGCGRYGAYVGADSRLGVGDAIGVRHFGRAQAGGCGAGLVDTVDLEGPHLDE